MTEQTKPSIKLAKASLIYNAVPNILPGLAQDHVGANQLPYRESVRLCRFFYRRDPIASTVVNRMAEISATQIRNRRKSQYSAGEIADEVLEVFNTVARRIQTAIPAIVLSYLIDGMAVPQYEIVKVMGSRASDNLGRTRYFLPDRVWMRNPENITLRKTFNGGTRRAYLEIPSDDLYFIKNKGVWLNGTKDTQAYDDIVKAFPEYVARIQAGERTVPFNDFIIYRKLLPWNEYPIPYLEPALDPLDHKRYLKAMDRSIASRAIESFRHVKVGSDEYPADEDDIQATQDALSQKSSVERVYNLFTNHTVEISWVVPPMDVLLDASKYVEANADIFFALGFPRILTVGETEKSNSADNKIASLGVLSALKQIQADILEWVKEVYARVALENGFSRVPTPYFTAISLADTTQLIQYARDMIESNVISHDTAAAFYGTDWETELDQLRYENKQIGMLAPDDTTTEQSNNPSAGSRLRPETEQSTSI